MKLMKFATAEGWSRVASADERVEANRVTVSACREAYDESYLFRTVWEVVLLGLFLIVVQNDTRSL